MAWPGRRVDRHTHSTLSSSSSSSSRGGGRRRRPGSRRLAAPRRCQPGPSLSAPAPPRPAPPPPPPPLPPCSRHTNTRETPPETRGRYKEGLSWVAAGGMRRSRGYTLCSSERKQPHLRVWSVRAPELVVGEVEAAEGAAAQAPAHHPASLPVQLVPPNVQLCPRRVHVRPSGPTQTQTRKAPLRPRLRVQLHVQMALGSGMWVAVAV
eukprot:991323-Rhodomonas_salina.2